MQIGIGELSALEYIKGKKSTNVIELPVVMASTLPIGLHIVDQQLISMTSSGLLHIFDCG